MKRPYASERTVLFSYFLFLIAVGTILLFLPIAWGGEGRLQLVDSMFTAVSAVCVTGLITLDTAQFTLFGKVVILLLIQFGGLGIITFTTGFLLSSGERKVSFRNVEMIRKFYLNSIEFSAKNILKNILIMTILLEMVGAVLLWLRFRTTLPVTANEGPFFTALFHAISAFCNAGFSLFPDSLIRYAHDPYVLTIIMILIISGGLGFLVFDDIGKVLKRTRKRLSVHTKLVLITSILLILFGTLVFFLIERQRALAQFGLRDKIVNALFQAVTPRTAGFNAIDQETLTPTSIFLTMILMFIGGSPASIAGGIKTTTFAIVFLTIIKEIDWKGRIRIQDRMLPSATVSKATIFMGKAMGLLVLSTFLLTLTEVNDRQAALPFLRITFESFSAFGTVGLSVGLTSVLSTAGKIVVMCTMFAGRVGLISLSIPLFRDNEYKVDYPEEEVLIG